MYLAQIISYQLSKDAKDCNHLILELGIPQDWVPQAGMNVAYSMPNPVGPEDIAAVERRITFRNGTLRKNGKAKYGSAEHSSFLLMSVMKFDPEIRATINLEYSEDLCDVMEEVGLEICRLDRKRYKDLRLGELTNLAVREIGHVPDAFIDREPQRKKNDIRIVGKSPADVLSKIELFL